MVANFGLVIHFFMFFKCERYIKSFKLLNQNGYTEVKELET